MTCRQCGTVIAEKALICYKCGTPTTEAKYAPVPIRDGARPRRVALLATLVVVLLIGVSLGEMGSTSTVRSAGWAVAVAAALVFGGRLVVGRRR